MAHGPLSHWAAVALGRCRMGRAVAWAAMGPAVVSRMGPLSRESLTLPDAAWAAVACGPLQARPQRGTAHAFGFARPGPVQRIPGSMYSMGART